MASRFQRIDDDEFQEGDADPNNDTPPDFIIEATPHILIDTVADDDESIAVSPPCSPIAVPDEETDSQSQPRRPNNGKDDEWTPSPGSVDPDAMAGEVTLERLPRPVKELNCRMARSYLVRLLRAANGNQNPAYGNPKKRPPFWPDYYWNWEKLTDVHTKPRGMTEPLQYSEMMKIAIKRGYQYYGYNPDEYIDRDKDCSEKKSGGYGGYAAGVTTAAPTPQPPMPAGVKAPQARWALETGDGTPPKLPRPLSRLNCVQSRTTLSKLLRFQQGGNNPVYGSPQTKPPWWPEDSIRWVDIVDLRGKPPYLPDQKTYSDVLKIAIGNAVRYFGFNPETYVEDEDQQQVPGPSSDVNTFVQPAHQPILDPAPIIVKAPVVTAPAPSVLKQPIKQNIISITPPTIRQTFAPASPAAAVMARPIKPSPSPSPQIQIIPAPEALRSPPPAPVVTLPVLPQLPQEPVPRRDIGTPDQDEDPDMPPKLLKAIRSMTCSEIRIGLSKLLWFYNKNQPPNYGNILSMPVWWPQNIIDWTKLKNLRHKYAGKLGNSYTNCLRVALIRGYAHYGLDANSYLASALHDPKPVVYDKELDQVRMEEERAGPVIAAVASHAVAAPVKEPPPKIKRLPPLISLQEIEQSRDVATVSKCKPKIQQRLGPQFLDQSGATRSKFQWDSNFFPPRLNSTTAISDMGTMKSLKQCKVIIEYGTGRLLVAKEAEWAKRRANNKLIHFEIGDSKALRLFDYNRLMPDGGSCDLIVQGKNGASFYGHRFVFAAHSRKIQWLLYDMPDFKDHSVLIFPEIEGPILKILVDAVYRGEVKVSKDQFGKFKVALALFQKFGILTRLFNTTFREGGLVQYQDPADTTSQESSTNTSENEDVDVVNVNNIVCETRARPRSKQNITLKIEVVENCSDPIINIVDKEPPPKSIAPAEKEPHQLIVSPRSGLRERTKKDEVKQEPVEEDEDVPLASLTRSGRPTRAAAIPKSPVTGVAESPPVKRTRPGSAGSAKNVASRSPPRKPLAQSNSSKASPSSEVEQGPEPPAAKKSRLSLQKRSTQSTPEASTTPLSSKRSRRKGKLANTPNFEALTNEAFAEHLEAGNKSFLEWLVDCKLLLRPSPCAYCSEDVRLHEDSRSLDKWLWSCPNSEKKGNHVKMLDPRANSIFEKNTDSLSWNIKMVICWKNNTSLNDCLKITGADVDKVFKWYDTCTEYFANATTTEPSR